MCEQSRARRLGQHVTRTVGPTGSHEQEFLIASLGKVDLVFFYLDRKTLQRTLAL